MGNCGAFLQRSLASSGQFPFCEYTSYVAVLCCFICFAYIFIFKVEILRLCKNICCHITTEHHKKRKFKFMHWHWRKNTCSPQQFDFTLFFQGYALYCIHERRLPAKCLLIMNEDLLLFTGVLDATSFQLHFFYYPLLSRSLSSWAFSLPYKMSKLQARRGKGHDSDGGQWKLL